MSQPIVVYIYGSAGCGKSRMLDEVFGERSGYVHRGSVKIGLRDDYRTPFAEWWPQKMPMECDYLIIAGDCMPEQITIHIDHCFPLDSADNLKECRKFLESISGN